MEHSVSATLPAAEIMRERSIMSMISRIDTSFGGAIGACGRSIGWHTDRKNHGNMHVRRYKEKGNINTTMEFAINNEIDRFTLAIEAIDRTPKLQKIGAHAKEKYRDQQTDCRNYEHGIDQPEIVAWDSLHRLELSNEEQERRFKARIADPLQQWKLNLRTCPPAPARKA